MQWLIMPSNRKLNIDFARQPYCFLTFCKNILTKVAYFSKIHYHIQFQEPTLQH